MRVNRVTLALFCAVLHVWWVIYSCLSQTTPRDPNVKRILTWVPFFGEPYYNFGGGSRQAFEKAGCAVTACEIEANKRRAPLETYDALLFHGYEFYDFSFGVPKKRMPHQIYVFMCLEPMRTCTIQERFINFYNYTMTYRMDSDTPWPYFAVVDKVTGRDVAPSFSVNWETVNLKNDSQNAKDIAQLVSEKQKLVAWFVSNCQSGSGREKLADELVAAGAPVDIYGKCGKLSCPRTESDRCKNLLSKYFFYLAFENSLCTDYITEKVAHALMGGSVPIVLSGANLTHFLPPGSYIEADGNDVEALAKRLLALANNLSEYSKLFAWRSRYKVENRMPGSWPPGKHPLCELCKRLHEGPDQVVRSQEVRSWWHQSPSGGPACVGPD